jgi:hypothetical protein
MFALPRMLWKEVKRAEMNMMDTFLWKGTEPPQHKSFTERIEELKEKQFWPPECLAPDADDDEPEEELVSANLSFADHSDYFDYRSLSYIFRRVLKLAYFRIRALLEFMNVNPRALVSHQIFVALRYLLRHHVDMLYDRHLDHMILCCVYGICKTLMYIPEITFAKLIDAYVVVRGQEEGDITCQRVVRHIRLLTGLESNNDEPPIGNIIQLYNRVFVPNMKQHLLKNRSLQRAAEKLSHELKKVAPEAETNGTSKKERPGSIQVTVQDAPGKAIQEHLNAGGTVTIVEFGKASESTVAQANDIASAPPEESMAGKQKDEA